MRLALIFCEIAPASDFPFETVVYQSGPYVTSLAIVVTLPPSLQVTLNVSLPPGAVLTSDTLQSVSFPAVAIALTTSLASSGDMQMVSLFLPVLPAASTSMPRWWMPGRRLICASPAALVSSISAATALDVLTVALICHLSCVSLILLGRADGARFLQVLPLDVLALNQQIGHVILVDVADIGDRLTPDALACHAFDVVEPDVRIEPPRLRFAPQLAHAPRSRVVGGKREEYLVEIVHRLLRVVAIDHAPDELHAGMDVGLELRNVPD